MFARVLLLSCTVFLTAATPALAQNDWLPYASGYAALSVYPAFDVAVDDPATASKFGINGRRVDNAPVFGGTIGVWRAPSSSRLRWGVRGEGGYQGVTASPQVLSAQGTLGGRPYAGPLPFPAGDGSAASFSGAFLLGWRVGEDRGRAFGRVMPYAGIGGGVDRIALRLNGAEATDMAMAIRAIGGLSMGLGRRTAAFVEYQFSCSESDIAFGTQQNLFTVKPSTVVAGFTLGLF